MRIVAGQQRGRIRNRRKCAYCKGPNESSDHSPPKCLLIWPPLLGAKILTLPCCLQCNQSTSRYENIVWIVLALVGRHPILAQYRAAGGKVDRAFAQDSSLREAIDRCRNSQGNYQICSEVSTAYSGKLPKDCSMGSMTGFRLLRNSNFFRLNTAGTKLRTRWFRDCENKRFATLPTNLSPQSIAEGFQTCMSCRPWPPARKLGNRKLCPRTCFMTRGKSMLIGLGIRKEPCGSRSFRARTGIAFV